MQLEVKLQEVSQKYRLKVSNLEAEYRMEKSKQDQELQDALLKSQSRTLGGDWQELIDPTTQSVYYLNTTTGHSQWERPAEISASADEIAAVTCAICLDVLKGACVQCKNGHLFCRDCLRLHLTASQNPTCPTCRVYIENDGIRNKMAEQVAKKLSGLNDIDLEAKMKASPEHVLNEHKKVLATMTRSLEIERTYQQIQKYTFSIDLTNNDVHNIYMCRNILGNRLYADMQSASKTLIDQFEDNCIMKKAALDNVKTNYEKKLDALTKQREKIVNDSRQIFESKRKTLENTFKQKVQQLQVSIQYLGVAMLTTYTNVALPFHSGRAISDTFDRRGE